MGLFDLLLVAAGLMWPVFARPNEPATGTKLRPSVVWSSDERIINGADSVYGRHPYICSLQHDNRHICGSVIYNDKTVITAAHCLTGLTRRDLRVLCGTFELDRRDDYEQRSRVSSFLVYRGFEDNPDKLFPNDIALVELTSRLSFNSYVTSATIPNSSHTLDQQCQLLGWGRYGDDNVISNRLQEVTIGLLDQVRCRSIWGSNIRDSNICFSDPGQLDSACQGDSGGPAVCGGFVVGVSSFMSTDDTVLERCNQRTPSVYTRLSHYETWMRFHSFY